MNTLKFAYEMRTDFADPVWNHHYTLKCIPENNERQCIEDLCVRIDPEGIYEKTRDSFGNAVIFGSISGRHDYFAVSVTGKASTGLSGREKIKEPLRLGSYRVLSSFTAPGDGLKRYFVSLPLGQTETNYEKALLIMESLAEDYRYCPGITTIQTTAEEAWKLGAGVCQDWCHIMLALCRMAKIPCRYVVGMLVGEGYSHAWVEIEDHGYWYAMDPTNHLVVQEEHIRISCGRDYHDTIISKGIYTGSAGQRQDIRVCVTALPPQNSQGVF